MKYIVLPLILILSLNVSTKAGTPDKPELLELAKQYAAEAYKDCTSYQEESYIEKYAEILSRIEIKTAPLSTEDSYLPFSKVRIKNKCNADLNRDDEHNFNPEKFNPFKYVLDFSAKTDKIYRVDNTVYIIVIHAKS